MVLPLSLTESVCKGLPGEAARENVSVSFPTCKVKMTNIMKTICECWVANLRKALRVHSKCICSINGGIYDGDGKEKSRIWLSLYRNFGSRKLET